MISHAPESHLPLKPLTYSVLLALREGESYGYGIAKRIAEPDAGSIRLAPSNLYHVLDRLQASGLIEDAGYRNEEDGRRSYYRLSEVGRRVFEAETARLRAVLGGAAAVAERS